MVAREPSYVDPDSYVFTEEQLMQAKIDSADYKLTENFLTHARSNEAPSAHVTQHDPSKIEKARKLPVVDTDNYIKT